MAATLEIHFGETGLLYRAFAFGFHLKSKCTRKSPTLIRHFLRVLLQILYRVQAHSALRRIGLNGRGKVLRQGRDFNLGASRLRKWQASISK